MEKGGFIVEEEQLSVQAGVPRREQCLVCDKPIFLAERFRVGDRFYHRRCLQCARCRTQLTLGNFYETEVDGQFCCETCPDEEQRRRDEDTDSEDEVVQDLEMERQKRLVAAAEEEKRITSLISNRLAMFERKPQKMEEEVSPSGSGDKVRPSWRNSSLSDEQKSISMKMKFLEGSPEEEDQMEGSSELPPPLPSQGPPAVVLVEDKKEEKEKVETFYVPENKSPMKSLQDEKSLQEEKSVPEDVKIVSPKAIKENVPEDEDVILRPEKKLETFVRESQSVSNIREMFEKKGSPVQGKTEERSPGKVMNKMTPQAEEVNMESTEKDLLPRPESLSNFYSPISIPRVDRLRAEEHTVTRVLEFKTPRKPSEEDWRDVKESSSGDKGEETLVKDEGVIAQEKLNLEEPLEEDDVFLSPRPPQQSQQTIAMNINPEIIVGDDSDVNNLIISKEAEMNKSDGLEDINNEVTIELKDTTPETVPGNDDNIIKETEDIQMEEEEEVIIAAQIKEQKEEEGDEPSATKESDPIIKEPSLELSSEDGDKVEDGAGDKEIPSPVQDNIIDNKSKAGVEISVKSVTSAVTSPFDEEKEVQDETKYPLDLNPFGSDPEDDVEVMDKSVDSGRAYNASLNPFGDDEEEQEEKIKVVYRKGPVENKRVSTNPFGSDEEEEEVSVKSDSMMTPDRKRITPVPTPRKTFMSQRPEPSPRSSHLRLPHTDYYGSVSSLSKSSDFRGSTNSLSSTCSSANTSGTYQRTLKKRRAPLPPAMREANSAEILLSPSPRKSSNASMASDQSGQKSTSTSPRTLRKKRPAPKPPGPSPVAASPINSPEVIAPKETIPSPPSTVINPEETITSPPPSFTHQEQLHSTPLKVNQSSTGIIMDKNNCFTVPGGHPEDRMMMSEILPETTNVTTTNNTTTGRRVISVDDDLLEKDEKEDITSKTIATIANPTETDESVFYRRVIKPLTDDDATPVKDTPEVRSRQWEKMKQNKESENRNRQSLVSTSSDSGSGLMVGDQMADRFYNKSQQGKWKRRKGPAPSLPVPPKRVLQMLPIQEIKHELEVIEVQQQGLEKQGVILEKMIREKTEGQSGEENSLESSPLSLSNRNTTEVEGLIMQLFDLVVEKNELFRRQAELMYQRRQHRLEVEQADLEYEIRVLMAQPECNKTDSDKAKEETMIARLLEVVRQRNAVVDGLEMDRLREAQEDLGIKQEMENYTAKRDEEFSLQKEKPVKLSKKEKKTLKEEKKKLKNKKADVDKDYDETETSTADKSLNSSSGTLEKVKKKKKKFLIL